MLRKCKICQQPIKESWSQWQIYCLECMNKNHVKGGIKMEEEKPEVKKEKKKKEFGTARFVPCSKCGEKKFANSEVYANRIKKFGSEEAMLKSYVCRNCKQKE